jgi:hypothetical protein
MNAEKNAIWALLAALAAVLIAYVLTRPEINAVFDARTVAHQVLPK